MIDIPSELLEQFQRGNVLLFVGDLINCSPEGQSVADQLRARLAARCEITDLTRLFFPDIAEFYEDNCGRHELVQFVRDQLELLGGDAPRVAHHLIAGLTSCNVVATTCLDQRLERAFEAAGRPFDVIVYNSDLPYEDGRKTQLYKLCGTREQVDSLVLTKEQYDALEYRADTVRVLTVLKGYLARKTILFLGCDLADQYFQRLYGKIIGPLDRHARRPYALSATSLSPIVSGWCKHCQINVIGADPTIFLKTLIKQLAIRPMPAPDTRLPLVEESLALPPKPPYKFLDYYEAGDSAIFFGRRQEAQTLSSLIHAHRLVLLYGASGVGKTSLLLAGAVPLLESAELPYATFYVRALDDPAAAIRHAVKRKLPEAPLPEDRGLVDLMNAAAKHLGRTLIIILDQFEEFFISSSLQSQAAFIAELGALCDARDVPAKIVLSLRDDWLAAVSRIEERIPEVFHNRMHLVPLTREQALSAIMMPVERLGVKYEPALVERLLDDLTSDKKSPVMPPELQIVCSALYGRLKPGELLITLASYEELGGARGVLQQYLKDKLTQLGSGERTLARRVLEELVTSQRTKAVKTSSELAQALGVDMTGLEPVLEKLVQARLLRPLERAEVGRAYELAHEYLLQEINVGAEAQARKAAEELLAQELENWRRYGTCMSARHLQRVAPHVERLALTAEAWDLLLQSALSYNHDVQFWVTRHPDAHQAASAVLSFLMNADLKQEEQKALVINITTKLGRQENERQGWYRSLVAGLTSRLALADKEIQMRARQVLACMGLPPGLSWRERMSIYMIGLRLLPPKYLDQILSFGVGGFLGGLLGGFVLVLVGLLILPDFMHVAGRISVQAVARLILILGPSLGIAGLLIGLGLGMGIVLGRKRSLFIEATSSGVGGVIGGALVVGYLYLLDMFHTDISPLLAVPVFAVLCAFVSGLITCCMRVVKRLVRRGQAMGQIMAGAAMGVVLGSVGDMIFSTFPNILVTGVLFSTGVAVGLTGVEHWVVLEKEQAISKAS